MSEFESRVIELLERIAEQTKPAPGMQERIQSYIEADQKAQLKRLLTAIPEDSALSQTGN